MSNDEEDIIEAEILPDSTVDPERFLHYVVTGVSEPVAPPQPVAEPEPVSAADPNVYIVGGNSARINRFAIVSFISGILGFPFAFLLLPAPIAVLFGHMALSRIRITGEAGRGLAIAGLLLGYFPLIILVLFLVGIPAFSTLFTH